MRAALNALIDRARNQREELGDRWRSLVDRFAGLADDEELSAAEIKKTGELLDALGKEPVDLHTAAEVAKEVNRLELLAAQLEELQPKLKAAVEERTAAIGPGKADTFPPKFPDVPRLEREAARLEASVSRLPPLRERLANLLKP